MCVKPRIFLREKSAEGEPRIVGGVYERVTAGDKEVEEEEEEVLAEYAKLK